MVDLGSLSEVPFFKEFSCDALKSKENGKLLCNWVLVKVRSVFNTEERNRELNLVSLRKSLILVYEIASEVGMKFVLDSSSRQSYDHVLLHGLESFLK